MGLPVKVGLPTGGLPIEDGGLPIEGGGGGSAYREGVCLPHDIVGRQTPSVNRQMLVKTLPVIICVLVLFVAKGIP